jgi:hypothetical protein
MKNRNNFRTNAPNGGEFENKYWRRAVLTGKTFRLAKTAVTGVTALPCRHRTRPDTLLNLPWVGRVTPCAPLPTDAFPLTTVDKVSISR